MAKTEKMPEWVEKRIEWFEKTLKGLRSGEIIGMPYNFGYCPNCNDIVEVTLGSNADGGFTQARFVRYFATCKKCSLHTWMDESNSIKCTGDEIPPKFKNKWERMAGFHSRTHQIKVHKEKMREFLSGLRDEIQAKKQMYNEAEKRLGKYLPKKT